MQVQDYQKSVIGIILKNPDTDIPKRIVSELNPSKFSSNSSHKLIYSAISEIVKNKYTPNTLTVAAQLGGNLQSCGGIEYLESLVKYPSLMGTHDNNGWKLWVEVVDNAGTLYLVGQTLDKYAKLYEDFERLVTTTSNVDEFMTNLMGEFNRTISPRSGYIHLSEAIDEELRYARQEGKGFVVDVVNCGIPSLMKYQIPRPSSFGGILGISSTGKTSLAIGMLLGAAYHLKNNSIEGSVYFHTLDTRIRRVARRVGCMIARVDSMELAHGKLSKEHFHRYMLALEWAKTLPFYLDDRLLTSNEMRWQAVAGHLQSPRVLSISDYAEKFRDENNQSEERRMNMIISNHRWVCTECCSCEVLLSQVGPEVSKSASKILNWSDARYTRSFENDIDWGLVVWNPPQMRARNISYQLPKDKRDDMAYVFIQKNKEYDLGEEIFEWQPQWMGFRDTSLPMNHFWDSEPWQFVEPEW